MMTTTTSGAKRHRFFDLATKFLGTVVWGSALIFGLYILAFYALGYVTGDTDRWNKVLPGLYDPGNAGSTAGIALHFLAGGTILVLGCLQLLEGVRKKYPGLHRVVGRVYVIACMLAGVGGLVFILLKGTIGGTVMNVGFTGYGVLMLLASVQTIRFARKGKFDHHRAWALRLFALAIASWLYRMSYGFYIGFGGEGGHTDNFQGWFDYVMDFAFYLPNLLVVEIILGEFALLRKPWVKSLGAAVMLIAGALISFATFIFIRDFWGPGIMSAF
ncbi:MAG: DUF2306 domain-containing protein [Bacteroidota bacterium]